MSLRYFVVPLLLTLLLFPACGSENNPTVQDSTQGATPLTSTPTKIGSTGLTINLVQGYAIDSQIDSGFKVYYFKPTAIDAKEDEAGIYFGPRPDTSAPRTEYSKKTFQGEFMGNITTWTEYTTEKYTQREVFIDRGPDDKIHCWCYSHDPASLEKLFNMIRSIH